MKRRETERLTFSKSKIAGLEAPKKGRMTVYDTNQQGLACAVYPSGTRTFFWYRTVAGKCTWKTLGNFPALSVEQARVKAAEANGQLEKYKDSALEGRNPFETRKRLTLGAAVDLYVEQHLEQEAKNPAVAVKEMRRLRDGHLGVWKNRSVGAIRRPDVIELMFEVRRTSGLYAANRMVQMLKAVFNFLRRVEKFDGSNPCQDVELFQQQKRKRFLQPDELPALFAALASGPPSDTRDFVLLALATGARRGDVLSARWCDIHLARKVWAIPSPKNATPYEVQLTDQAVSVFTSRRERLASDFVFPSRRGSKSGHVQEIKKSWKTLLNHAGIEGLRIHDLRRTLGSWQATAGVSPLIIGKSLGHKSLQATEIYAQVADAAVRESVANANDELFSAGKVSVKKLLEAPSATR